MADVRETLNERGSRYGRFDSHANIADTLIITMQAWPGWMKLQSDQRQALRVIADKIARILNGDPNYVDNWLDIAGYATLIVDRLNGTGIYAAAEDDYDSLVQPVEATDHHRCPDCFAWVGDAHAPDCATLARKKAGNPR